MLIMMKKENNNEGYNQIGNSSAYDNKCSTA